jgi:hypothetical protein
MPWSSIPWQRGWPWMRQTEIQMSPRTGVTSGTSDIFFISWDFTPYKITSFFRMRRMSFPGSFLMYFYRSIWTVLFMFHLYRPCQCGRSKFWHGNHGRSGRASCNLCWYGILKFWLVKLKYQTSNQPKIAFYIAPNRDEVLKMVEMNPIPTPNCDGVVNKSGCFELVTYSASFFLHNFSPCRNWTTFLPASGLLPMDACPRTNRFADSAMNDVTIRWWSLPESSLLLCSWVWPLGLSFSEFCKFFCIFSEDMLFLTYDIFQWE